MFLKERDGKGLSVNEIKERIRIYCEARDARDTYNIGGAVRKPMRCDYSANRPYVVREGREIMRDKIK